MRKITLFICVFVLIAACQAFGEGYWPPSNVEIDPQNPTSTDVVAIILSGEWPDSGIPTESSILVSGYDIYFDVVSNHGFLTVLTPWQLTESTGPLPVGTYTVYTKLLDDPFVDETYTQVGEFTVAETNTYVFVPEQSSVVMTGGFTGVHETFDIAGSLALAVNSDANTAWFDHVHGDLYHDGVPLDTTLDLLLGMTEMISTSVSDTVIEFESNSLLGGITGELTLTFEEGDSVHLRGTFTQPYLDGFQYDLDAVARKIIVSEASWIGGETPPATGWQILPPAPNANDLIDFTCAIRNGEIYGNSCEAAQAMGGTPVITINAVSKNIELRFEPPAPEICTTEADPVCGLEGAFGPLEAGEWDFRAYFPGQVQLRSFHVFIPGDLDGDDDVDLRDFAGFSGQWLKSGCGICDGADLTGDGNVGEDDMRIFAGNWLADTK